MSIGVLVTVTGFHAEDFVALGARVGYSCRVIRRNCCAHYLILPPTPTKCNLYVSRQCVMADPSNRASDTNI